eukprot:SAG11_NODE_3702_length_2269_cov_8.750000_3_plen_93_part_00
MLLGNVTVGAKILASFPTFALLRRHPTPDPANFDWLVKSAAQVGVKVDGEHCRVPLPQALHSQQLLQLKAPHCCHIALPFGSLELQGTVRLA